MQNIVVSTMVAETQSTSNIYDLLNKNATSLHNPVLEIFVYMGKIRVLQ